MSKIQEIFNFYCQQPSDINQHLPTLKRYSDQCEVVVEMGVRNVVSTWAFLASNAREIISYDINFNQNIKQCQDICNLERRNWKFILDSSLTCDIPECDLLFIDTFHTFSQLSRELQIHSSKVRKWIICHDTESYGLISENQSKPGLQQAVNLFVEKSILDKWKIKEHYQNNNGLTILERIN
jgi:hypothetical protein